MERTVLIVPGLRGSGPGHWQTLLQARHLAHPLQARHPSYRRVLQHDWLAPRLDDWAAALEGAIDAVPGPAFVAAHGFGCLATLARLARSGRGVAGVLLAAPRHPDEFGFAPQRLEMPAIVVGSRSDPCMSLGEAHRLARRLDAHFIDAGDAGHLDGAWPKAERVLARLFALADARERELAIALATASG
jgi:predicted alpha/beta hydrolase family esterase